MIIHHMARAANLTTCYRNVYIKSHRGWIVKISLTKETVSNEKHINYNSPSP